VGRKRIGLHPLAREGLRVLGQQVRLARLEKGWTAAELAAAVGVSPTTLSAIENGSPSVSVGNVLNVAAVAGVPLFELHDSIALAGVRQVLADRLALLPSRVDHPRTKGGDDDLDF